MGKRAKRVKGIKFCGWSTFYKCLKILGIVFLHIFLRLSIRVDMCKCYKKKFFLFQKKNRKL